MKKVTWSLIFGLALSGCATSKKSYRTILDSSGSRPEWVSGDVTFEKEGAVFVRGQSTVRGDQRLSGCYDLTKLQVRESVLSEISTEIRAKVNSAEQDLSENAEIYLGRTVITDVKGDVQGMRIRQYYFERYSIGETERIDCFVLASISKRSYEELKQRIVNKVVQIDPKLKEALVEDQIKMVRDAASEKRQGDL